MFPPKRNRELIFLSSRKLINSGLENGASSLIVNANGWAAYDSVDLEYLENRLITFYPKVNFVKTSVEKFGLSGLSAHYVNFSEEEYKKAIDSL